LTLQSCSCVILKSVGLLHVHDHVEHSRWCLPFTSQPEESEVTSGSTFSLLWGPGPPSSMPGRKTTPAQASWIGPSCRSTPGARTRGVPGPWRFTTTPSRSGPLTPSSSSGPWNSTGRSSIPTPRSIAELTRRGSTWSGISRRKAARRTRTLHLRRQRRQRPLYQRRPQR